MSAVFNRMTFYRDLCFKKGHALKSSQLTTTQKTIVVHEPSDYFSCTQNCELTGI